MLINVYQYMYLLWHMEEKKNYIKKEKASAWQIIRKFYIVVD